MTGSSYRRELEQTRRNYFTILRRAARIGWAAARAEYLPAQLEVGRARDEIMHELAVFEQLNSAAARRGFDPVLEQRRRDFFTWSVRPVAVSAGVLSAIVGASKHAEPLPVIAGSMLIFLVLEVIGRRCILPLVGRPG